MVMLILFVVVVGLVSVVVISVTEVAFTPRRITRRKMVVFLMKKIFFINHIAKSTAYYAA